MDVDADDRAEDDQMPIDDSPGTPLPDAEGDAMMVDEDGNLVDGAIMEVEVDLPTGVELDSEPDGDDMNAEPTPPLGAGPSISPFAPPGPANVDPFSLAVDQSMPSFAGEPPGSALPQGVDELVERVEAVQEVEQVAVQPHVLDTNGATHETPVREEHPADRGEEQQAQGAEEEYIGEDEEEYPEGEGEEYQAGGEHQEGEEYHEGEAEEYYEEGEEHHEEGEEHHEEQAEHHEEDEGHYEDGDGHYEEEEHQEEGASQTEDIEGEQTGEAGVEEESPDDHAAQESQSIANGVAELPPPAEDLPATAPVAGPSTPRSPPVPPAEHHGEDDVEEHGDEPEGDYDEDSDIEHYEEEFDEEEMEHYPTDAHSLTPFILHLPDLGARSLFNPLPDGAKLPVWLDTRLEELGEGTLSDVWMEIRNEMANEGLAQSGEMIITEKQMDLKMGEDDVNLQYITLLDLAQVHHGCGLPGPVQLYITFEPHRFITRFNAIQQEVQAQFKREQEAAEASSEDEEVVGEREVEEADTKTESHEEQGREDYRQHRRTLEIAPAEHGSQKAKHTPVESEHPNADWANMRLIQPIHTHGTRIIASPKSETTEIFTVPPPPAPRETVKAAQRRADEREAPGGKEDLSDEEKDTIEGTESDMTEQTLEAASLSVNQPLSAPVTSSGRTSGYEDEAIGLGDEEVQREYKPSTPLSPAPLDDYAMHESLGDVGPGSDQALEPQANPFIDAAGPPEEMDEGISMEFDPVAPSVPIPKGTPLDEVELAKLHRKTSSMDETDQLEPGSSDVPLDEAAKYLSEEALRRLSAEPAEPAEPQATSILDDSAIPTGTSISAPASTSQNPLPPASMEVSTGRLSEVPEVPEDVEESSVRNGSAQSPVIETTDTTDYGDDTGIGENTEGGDPEYDSGPLSAAEKRLRDAERKLQDAEEERDKAYELGGVEPRETGGDQDEYGLQAFIENAVRESSAIGDLSVNSPDTLNEGVSATVDIPSLTDTDSLSVTTSHNTSLPGNSTGQFKRRLGDDDEDVSSLTDAAEVKKSKTEW